jgi:hypothetical protein
MTMKNHHVVVIRKIKKDQKDIDQKKNVQVNHMNVNVNARNHHHQKGNQVHEMQTK